MTTTTIHILVTSTIHRYRTTRTEPKLHERITEEVNPTINMTSAGASERQNGRHDEIYGKEDREATDCAGVQTHGGTIMSAEKEYDQKLHDTSEKPVADITDGPV